MVMYMSVWHGDVHEWGMVMYMSVWHGDVHECVAW